MNKISLFADNTIRRWHLTYDYDVTDKIMEDDIIDYVQDANKDHNRIYMKEDSITIMHTKILYKNIFPIVSEAFGEEIKTGSDIQNIHFTQSFNEKYNNKTTLVVVVGSKSIRLFTYSKHTKRYHHIKSYIFNSDITSYCYDNMEEAIVQTSNNRIFIINYYDYNEKPCELRNKLMIFIKKIVLFKYNFAILDANGDVYLIKNREMSIIYRSDGHCVNDISSMDSEVFGSYLYIIIDNGSCFCFTVDDTEREKIIPVINGEHVLSVYHNQDNMVFVETSGHIIKRCYNITSDNEYCSNGVSLDGVGLDRYMIDDVLSLENNSILNVSTWVLAVNKNGHVFSIETDIDNSIIAKKIEYFDDNPLYVSIENNDRLVKSARKTGSN